MKSLWILGILIGLLSSAHAAVKDPVYDNYEGLDLVEVLIRDGSFAEAEVELSRAKGTDRKWLVAGHLDFATKKYESAARNYLKAQESPMRNLFLARAYGQSRSWSECDSSFEKSGVEWLGQESDGILKATCEYQLKKWQESLNTLHKAEKRWPGFVIQREKVSLFLEMGLTRSALEAAFSRGHETTASESLALAELFQNKQLTSDALIIVEWARTRFPFDLDTNLSLAKVYFAKGQLHSTAEAFERAARVDSRFIYHAAEIRRQLGEMQAANYWIPQVSDEKERLRSRLALYVDSNWYSMIASMESVLSSSPLNGDDEARYALGYSLMRLGDFERPLRYLSKIRSPHHAERAALLKKSILEARKQ